MAVRFDVVIVPDFLGSRPYPYEVRTLFFLASWLENSGKSRDLPLHVACIGEPPPSVRRAAARCGAMISVHPPYASGSYWNKFRGLEVEKREEQFLLLDVDTIVCGDLSELGEFGHCIAVAPRGLPGIPESYWEPIYKTLGMEPPTERIPSYVGEADLPLPKRADPIGQFSAYKAMTPCYNGGVVFAPWSSDLRRFWEEHLLTVSRSFSRDDAVGRAVTKDDQLCLATAIDALKRRGVPVRLLPRQYNADLTYVYRSGVKPAELKIVHAIGLFASLGRNGADIHSAIRAFVGEELRSVARDLLRQDIKSSQRAAAVRYLFPSFRKSLYLRRLLEKLHKKHVQPVLAGAA
jgi:hypothetical protein